MWLNLSSIFRQLSHDPNVRAVILTGAGDRAFTAGLDVQAASTGGALAQTEDATAEPLDSARKANALRRHILEFQSCITDIEKCEKRTSEIRKKKKEKTYLRFLSRMAFPTNYTG